MTAVSRLFALPHTHAPRTYRPLLLHLRGVCTTSTASSTSTTSTTTNAHNTADDASNPAQQQRTRASALSGDGTKTTHFGYRQVPLSEKQTLVSSIFSSVANNYDVMNDIMSLRVHRLWKAAFVNDMAPTGDMHILDCAGGTADIAMRISDYVHHNHNGWTTTTAATASTSTSSSAETAEVETEKVSGVTVCDINDDMLAVGRQRVAKRLHDASCFDFTVADAQQLPFQDATFDIYAISFGMRNVPDPAQALREAFRVLKPGGRFMMLEFGKVAFPPVRRLYDTWSFAVIPTIGRVVAGDEQAYRYLVESIRRFPGQGEVLAMLADAGFAVETATDYSFGISTCYSAFKIA